MWELFGGEALRATAIVLTADAMVISCPRRSTRESLSSINMSSAGVCRAALGHLIVGGVESRSFGTCPQCPTYPAFWNSHMPGNGYTEFIIRRLIPDAAYLTVELSH
jgi:hypothetical protein